MSYTLIERKELTEAASSISFENIPQFYSDLVILASIRSAYSDLSNDLRMSINGLTTNRIWRDLFATGSSVFSYNQTTTHVGNISGNTATSNTFGNASIYIANYTAAVNKSISFDTITENNATTAYMRMGSGLWSSTAAITSLTFTDFSASNLLAGSSISLYGINRQQAIGAPKAVGGAISFANGYWVHSFTGSGTFTAQADLSIDGLVVAGGGGGGGAGGGGAGGYRTLFNSSVTKGSYPVVVGSGGSGSTSWVTYNQTNGSNSIFSITSSGGGFGGSADSLVNGAPGGSGGGGGMVTSSSNVPQSGSAGNTPATSPSQGNSGGSGVYIGGVLYGGGGGGAGAGSSSINGGSGATWVNSQTYAGGGGGGARSTATGTGGSGGGGNGSTSKGFDGSANTGGGGGGGGITSTPYGGGNGGSGIVIIRYKA